jgi:YidC/Oxa1 family membrane protein insertase
VNKRLIATMLVFTAGVFAYLLWANSQQAQPEPQPQQQTAQDRPAPQPTTKPAEAQADATQPTTAAAEVAAPNDETPATAPAAEADAPAGEMCFLNAAAKPDNPTLGSLEPEGPYELQLQLSSRGAAVKYLKLANFFATVADKKLAEKDPQAYRKALAEKNRDDLQGHYSLLNAVGTGDDAELSYATRQLVIRRPGRPDQRVNLASANWNVQSLPATQPGQADQVRFTLTVYCGTTAAEAQKSPLVRLVKTYSLTPGNFGWNLDLAVENLTGQAVTVGIDQAGPLGIPREDQRNDVRQAAYGYIREGLVQVALKPRSELNEWQGQAEMPVTNVRDGRYLGPSTGDSPMLWLGVTNKFFGSMMYLRPAEGTEDSLAASEYDARFYLASRMEQEASPTFATGVQVPSLELQPGQSRRLQFNVFSGPKDRGILQDDQLYSQLNYVGVIDLGGCICAFDWLILLMLGLLDLLSKLALGNYGVAIILLVAIVRLLLHPLTKRSQVNMMKMQKLGPEMQKIKAKYKDDPNAMNQEMMRFYKTQGATPLLGCLPMFLQMPIWIALWTGLNASIQLRHAAFLPVWLTDLAAPDVIFSWDQPLPLVGITGLHLLPILLAVAMFLQGKLNPQAVGAAAASATPEQQQQQKMMKIMMPLMMLFIFYKAPSGLTLYIMTSTFIGVGEQYIIRKHLREKEEQQGETMVDVPGKGARSHRAKKPKGPFWHKNG